MPNSKAIRIGRWDAARYLTSNIGNDINAANTIALRKISLKAERIMVKYILSQPSVWPALSPTYLEQKKRKGLSNKTLIASSSMYGSIKPFSNDKIAFAGLKRKVKNKDGEELANIAAIMEFGSKRRNIKPRPFIAPTYQAVLRWMNKNKIFVSEIDNFIRKKYGVKPM